MDGVFLLCPYTSLVIAKHFIPGYPACGLVDRVGGYEAMVIFGVHIFPWGRHVQLNVTIQCEPSMVIFLKL